LMVVSRSYRHQLPGKAVGRALVDGLAAVLVRITLDSDLARSDTADSQNMSILPVTESELLAWNLTPRHRDRSGRAKDSNPRSERHPIGDDTWGQNARRREQTADRSDRMLWVDDLLGTRATEGTLVAMPS
ncbi:MAG: hypothetical protein ACKVHU_18830, partial [Acidimicrobiales bacterium]